MAMTARRLPKRMIRSPITSSAFTVRPMCREGRRGGLQDGDFQGTRVSETLGNQNCSGLLRMGTRVCGPCDCDGRWPPSQHGPLLVFPCGRNRVRLEWLFDVVPHTSRTTRWGVPDHLTPLHEGREVFTLPSWPVFVGMIWRMERDGWFRTRTPVPMRYRLG